MGQDQELAILFADVVGSTRLFEILGDVAARDKVSICIEIMRRGTEQHGGSVVKTMGDEIMATFADCDAAIDAAVEMQAAIAGHPDLEVEGQQITIRIGCHFGPVVIETRDVFGAAVHTANRMTSQAKAGQIITTSATVERLSPEWRASVRQIDVATIRGQGTEVALYEDAVAGKQMRNLLGEAYLAISPGTTGKRQLKDGDELRAAPKGATPDELLQNMSRIAQTQANREQAG